MSKRKSVKKNPVRDTRATAEPVKLVIPSRKSPWADTASTRPDKWLET